MTGGGFGGCCVALVETARVRSVAAKLAKAYRAKTGITPALFVSRPGPGATLLRA